MIFMVFRHIWVKICGLVDGSQVRMAVEAGADAVGFVFAPSSRRVSPVTAARSVAGLNPRPVTVGVFVDAAYDEISRVLEVVPLDYVQLHGGETPLDCTWWKRQGVGVIKTIKMGADGRSLSAPGDYAGLVDYMLLDTVIPGKHGGTGIAFNWEAVVSIRQQAGVTPLILAGGLNPANVERALAVARPDGVDVSSGVETAGSKDPQKIKQFIQVVRRWQATCTYPAP